MSKGGPLAARVKEFFEEDGYDSEDDESEVKRAE
jgi:hypothetical protein